MLIFVRVLICSLIVCLGLAPSFASDRASNINDTSVSSKKIEVCAISQLYHPLEEIKEIFKKQLNIDIFYASASTMYSLVVNGQRKCDIYLGNDNKFIAKYIESKLADANSKMVFTKTPLALWSITSIVDKDCNILKYNTFTRVAIPNPRVHVSGFAALEVLKSLKLDKKMQAKFLYTPNEFLSISFVRNGNAMLGFVPYALIKDNSYANSGSYCLIPKEHYEPLYYYAVDFLDISSDTKMNLGIFKRILLNDAKPILEKHGFF